MIAPYTVTVTRGGKYPAEPLTWDATGNSVDEALQDVRDQIFARHDEIDALVARSEAGENTS